MCKEEAEAKRFIRLSSTKRPNLYLRMSNQRRTMTIKPQTLLTINPNLSWRTNPYHSHSMLLSSTKRWQVKSTLKSESRPTDATFSSISQLQSTTSGLYDRGRSLLSTLRTTLKSRSRGREVIQWRLIRVILTRTTCSLTWTLISRTRKLWMMTRDKITLSSQ